MPGRSEGIVTHPGEVGIGSPKLRSRRNFTVAVAIAASMEILVRRRSPGRGSGVIGVVMWMLAPSLAGTGRSQLPPTRSRLPGTVIEARACPGLQWADGRRRRREYFALHHDLSAVATRSAARAISRRRKASGVLVARCSDLARRLGSRSAPASDARVGRHDPRSQRREHADGPETCSGAAAFSDSAGLASLRRRYRSGDQCRRSRCGGASA